jgi:ribosomal-protein-alanine N-acetyltransferase
MMVADVVFVAMTLADLDELFPYEETLFGTEAWTRQTYVEELRDTDTRQYIVARSSELGTMGCGGLLVLAETAQVMTISVRPTFQGHGVGRALLRELIVRARASGATELLLEVREDNRVARHLYESEGFAVLGTRRGYYANGSVDAVTMRYVL